MPRKLKKIRVLFVCLGNICRSPMAEALFNHIVVQAGLQDKIVAHSAGTGSWHVGQPPHSGTIAVLAEAGIDVGGKLARQLAPADLNAYDYIIAMDDENVRDIETILGKRVRRLLESIPSGAPTLNVPDPYQHGNFREVYRLVEAGCEALLQEIRAANDL